MRRINEANFFGGLIWVNFLTKELAELKVAQAPTWAALLARCRRKCRGPGQGSELVALVSCLRIFAAFVRKGLPVLLALHTRNSAVATSAGFRGCSSSTHVSAPVAPASLGCVEAGASSLCIGSQHGSLSDSEGAWISLRVGLPLCAAGAARGQSAVRPAPPCMVGAEPLEVGVCRALARRGALHRRGDEGRGRRAASPVPLLTGVGAARLGVHGLHVSIGGSGQGQVVSLEDVTTVPSCFSHRIRHPNRPKTAICAVASQFCGRSKSGREGGRSRWNSQGASRQAGPASNCTSLSPVEANGLIFFALCVMLALPRGWRGRRQVLIWVLLISTRFTLVVAPRPDVPLAKRGALAWTLIEKGGYPSGVNPLLLHAVGDNTNIKYMKAVRELFGDLVREGVPWTNPEQRDRVLADYLADMCFARRLGAHRGDYLFSGLMHFYPNWRGHMPLSTRALKSWHRLVGVGAEGGPMSAEAVAVLALELARAGHPIAAIVVLLSDDCYLRGQDWRALRVSDVAVSDDEVSLLFGVRERGEKAKTGSNQGVVIEAEYLKFVLASVVSRLAPKDFVFVLERTRFRRLYTEAALRRGLEWVGPPHNLRHSKPARDAKNNVRSLEQIRRRGRWVALSSVERYSKGHWLVRHRARLSQDILEEGQRFLKAPERVLGEAILQGQGASVSADAAAILRGLSESSACESFALRHCARMSSPRLGK